MQHRSSRAQRRRTPPLRIDCERLEPRRCLAAATGGTQRIDWHGQQVDARCGAWVVRTERPLAAADLAGGLGWRTTPLGDGCELLIAPGVSADGIGAWAGRTHTIVSIEPVSADPVILNAVVYTTERPYFVKVRSPQRDRYHRVGVRGEFEAIRAVGAAGILSHVLLMVWLFLGRRRRPKFSIPHLTCAFRCRPSFYVCRTCMLILS